eukprot:6138759-Prymnesium_polylepis.1
MHVVAPRCAVAYFSVGEGLVAVDAGSIDSLDHSCQNGPGVVQRRRQPLELLALDDHDAVCLQDGSCRGRLVGARTLGRSHCHAADRAATGTEARQNQEHYLRGKSLVPGYSQ